MTPNEKRPLIGLMLGDPTGIGPEVALKLLARPETHAQAKILVVGDVRVFESTTKELGLALKPLLVQSAADIDWQSL
jgi:4-hydroxythreonine-4-phosphate dehydrogenase